ncbi:hypothetical protein QMK19_07945 [Streptomyces sp. H10-C2]|uniref:hypothetical protein n=1 Tax=unclassified Streptomyces TaxID=2593676 RepID=UPI0024BA2BFE|nr:MULTISPECIES: hypothetical protein [unclassified Streptomyces]MDJ0344516.1 hypothetical protein [Streptomyces sp. PH10-H1]MDJ0369610.1 hypothetical protein [Streptomyces sp. H10-C2]
MGVFDQGVREHQQRRREDDPRDRAADDERDDAADRDHDLRDDDEAVPRLGGEIPELVPERVRRDACAGGLVQRPARGVRGGVAQLRRLSREPLGGIQLRLGTAELRLQGGDLALRGGVLAGLLLDLAGVGRGDRLVQRRERAVGGDELRVQALHLVVHLAALGECPVRLALRRVEGRRVRVQRVGGHVVGVRDLVELTGELADRFLEDISGGADPRHRRVVPGEGPYVPRRGLRVVGDPARGGGAVLALSGASSGDSRSWASLLASAGPATKETV